MEIEVITNEGAIPEVRIVGEIDMRNSLDLRNALERLATEGHSHILIDMGKVPFIDSAALGVLVDIQRHLKERRGELRLTSVTPFVKRALEITRLIQIFAVYESLEAARLAETE